MSGLDKIKEKIMADARAKADEIIAGAEREAVALLGSAEAEGGEYRQKRLIYAEAEAKKAYERELSAAKMEAKKRLLAAKQEIVNQCFELARERILSMPLSSYEDFLIEQIVSAAEDGTEQLILSAQDSERISLLRFLSQVNSRLADAGEKAAITISEETVDAPAGFLLRRGEVVINCTLDAMLADKREELEVELAAILF